MKRMEHTRWISMLGLVLVRRIVSSYSGISSRLKRTRLSDQKSINAHSGDYVRLMMMKACLPTNGREELAKRCRNICRNLGFGALVLCIQNYSIANPVLGHDHPMD